MSDRTPRSGPLGLRAVLQQIANRLFHASDLGGTAFWNAPNPPFRRFELRFVVVPVQS